MCTCACVFCTYLPQWIVCVRVCCTPSRTLTGWVVVHQGLCLCVYLQPVCRRSSGQPTQSHFISRLGSASVCITALGPNNHRPDRSSSWLELGLPHCESAMAQGVCVRACVLPRLRVCVFVRPVLRFVGHRGLCPLCTGQQSAKQGLT